MGASSSAINPTQDFLARMGGRCLFDMGASTVKYGICYIGGFVSEVDSASLIHIGKQAELP